MEPENEQLCIPVHRIQNTHDTEPLNIQDKQKKRAMPYITCEIKT